MDPPTVPHRQSRKRSASDKAKKNNQEIFDDGNDVIEDEAVMPMESMQPTLTLDEDFIMVRVGLLFVVVVVGMCVCVCVCVRVSKLRMNFIVPF